MVSNYRRLIVTFHYVKSFPISTYYVDFVSDTTVSVPDDVDRLEFTSINISNGFTVIPYRCFFGFTNVINITLPESLVELDNDALEGISIEYLFIPKSLSTIHIQNPFDLTLTLKWIDVDPENKYYTSLDGVMYTKNMKFIVQYPCSMNLTTFVIPDGVESAYHSALGKFKYLKTLIVPESFINFGPLSFISTGPLENIIVSRAYKQKKPIYGDQSFSSNFKYEDIIYIYPIKPPITCYYHYTSFIHSLNMQVMVIIYL